MLTVEAIDRALVAHAAWKARLLTAISSGSSEFSPATVGLDSACEFGKWLGSLGDAVRHDPHYESVRSLHAKFHKIAGEVLAQATHGQAAAAAKRLEFGGDYGAATGSLVIALQEWKRALAAH